MGQGYHEFETGVVIGMDGDSVIVELSLQPECENCGARMVCSPEKNGKKSMKVTNKLGAEIGSTVAIGESADFLLKMSTLQYGIPFVGFMAGILILYGIDFHLADIAQEFLFFIGGLVGLGISAVFSNKIAKRMANGEESFFMITKIM